LTLPATSEAGPGARAPMTDLESDLRRAIAVLAGAGDRFVSPMH